MCEAKPEDVIEEISPVPKPHLMLVRSTRSVPKLVETMQAALSDVQDRADRRGRRLALRSALAGLVFAYWAHLFDHKKALLDPKRDRIIQQRLAECEDDVSQILYAMDMAAKDDWVMGLSARASHRNDSIEYLLRDRGMVEKFGERSKGFRTGQTHPMAAKYVPPEVE